MASSLVANTQKTSVFGNYRIITGACLVDSTADALALADSNTVIIFCALQSATALEAARVTLNSSDGTADTLNGSIYVDTTTDQNRYTYFAIVV